MSNLAMDNKNIPIDIQWFDNEVIVFSCLSRMIADGWVPSNIYEGVVYNGIVARPVKVSGSKIFTGVALWEI